MAAATLRHRSTIVFVLLCVLLVVRMPAQWLAEECSSAASGIELSLSFDASPGHASDATLAAIESDATMPGAAVPRTDTTARPIEYSILRL